MATMTKAKARKRLLEARAKFQKVYLRTMNVHERVIVTTSDMDAIEKIVAKCIKRIQ